MSMRNSLVSAMYLDLLMLVSAGFAAVTGFSLWKAYEKWQRKVAHKESLLSSFAKVDIRQESSSSLDARMFVVMEENTRKDSVGRLKHFCPDVVLARSKFETNAAKAGLAGWISTRGYEETRIRCALCFALAGAAVGFIFSLPFCLVLALSGAIIGFVLPVQIVRQRTEWRARELERHLPEMLDVVALGMRSGLSFDMSIKLYAGHFDTMLAHDMDMAERTWTSGLERRDEALRGVAATYASPLFSRVVETIIRSIRFGSSMVESLEAESVEARQNYRTNREEQIAKAPVKMMIPTGTLILPAMMILVLGPVLLELAEGGF